MLQTDISRLDACSDTRLAATSPHVSQFRCGGTHPPTRRRRDMSEKYRNLPGNVLPLSGASALIGPLAHRRTSRPQ